MITNKGTQTIQTERLKLRRFTVDDAQAMFDNWANDPRVTRYLTWSPHESPEATKQLLERWCAGKTTVCNVFFENETDYIILESDITWNNVYNTPEQAAEYVDRWIKSKLIKD